MKKQALHDKLFQELLEVVFLGNYQNNGTMKANECLKVARNYVNSLNISLSRENYKEIKKKTLDIVDCTVIS